MRGRWPESRSQPYPETQFDTGSRFSGAHSCINAVVRAVFLAALTASEVSGFNAVQTLQQHHLMDFRGRWNALDCHIFQ